MLHHLVDHDRHGYVCIRQVQHGPADYMKVENIVIDKAASLMCQ